MSGTQGAPEGQMPGIVEQVRGMGDKPSLASIEVVEQLWRDLLGGIFLRYSEMSANQISREEALEWVAKNRLALVQTLTGGNPAYVAMPSWNTSPEGMAASMRDAVVDIVSAELLKKEGPVMAFVASICHETYRALAALTNGEATLEETKDRMDILVHEGTRVTMGLPTNEELDGTDQPSAGA